MKKLNYRAKKCINAFIFYFAGLILISDYANAYSNPDQAYKSGQFDIAIWSDYYRSEQNFDANGTKQNLLNSNYYQLINVNPQIRWGVFDSLGTRIGFNIASAESSDVYATRKNSTFNRIDFGIDYLLMNLDGFQGIVDVEYSYSPDKIQTNTDAVINGVGASEFKPTFILRMSVDQLYPYSLIGINYRSDGLSTLLTYGIGAEYRFSEMGLGLAINGFSTIKNDDKSNNAIVRDAIINRVNAGSKKFYSINPNLLSIETYLKFLVTDNTAVKAFANYDIHGSNIAQGFTVGAVLTFSFDSGLSFQSDTNKQIENKNNAVKKNNNYQSRPKTYGPKKSQDRQSPKLTEDADFFKEDTDDGVNQDYFKPVRPQQEEYIQPIDSNNSQNETQQNQFETTISNKQDSVNNDSDPSGYTIKLKKKKKKGQ